MSKTRYEKFEWAFYYILGFMPVLTLHNTSHNLGYRVRINYKQFYLTACYTPDFEDLEEKLHIFFTLALGDGQFHTPSACLGSQWVGGFLGPTVSVA